MAERAAARSSETSRRAQPLGICKGRRAVGDDAGRPVSVSRAHVGRRLGPPPTPRVREGRPGAEVPRTESLGKGQRRRAGPREGPPSGGRSGEGTAEKGGPPPAGVPWGAVP